MDKPLVKKIENKIKYKKALKKEYTNNVIFVDFNKKAVIK
jgi:hypothetical protein